VNPAQKIFPDIEADVDYRATAIDGVGVRSIVHPVNVSSASGEILQHFDGVTDYHGMRALMLAMVHRLGAETGWI
jgi:GTP cyclohydrolase FolE2